MSSLHYGVYFSNFLIYCNDWTSWYSKAALSVPTNNVKLAFENHSRLLMGDICFISADNSYIKNIGGKQYTFVTIYYILLKDIDYSRINIK